MSSTKRVNKLYTFMVIMTVANIKEVVISDEEAAKCGEAERRHSDDFGAAQGLSISDLGRRRSGADGDLRAVPFRLQVGPSGLMARASIPPK